jgi:hypothetical protein
MAKPALPKLNFPVFGSLHDRRHFLTPETTPVPLDPDVIKDYRITRVDRTAGRYNPERVIEPARLGVHLWRIGAGDVFEVMNKLRARGIDARPLYGFGIEGHWSLAPGGETPKIVDLRSFPYEITDEVRTYWPLRPGACPAIALVDGPFTGLFRDLPDASLPDRGLPGLLGRISSSAGLSPELAFEVHARFTATLVRMISPGSSIVFCPVGIVKSPDDFDGACDMSLPFTDDVHLADAIQMAHAHGAEIISLSLGTYVLPFGQDLTELPAPLATETQLTSIKGPDKGKDPKKPKKQSRGEGEGDSAVALSAAAGRKTTVVAAAGNDQLDMNLWRGPAPAGAKLSAPQFYPACREDVLAVGAADPSGSPVQWKHPPGYPNGPRHRVMGFETWWDVTAPGVDLVSGPIDVDDKHALRWSGSSFAAPVVAAALAAGCIDTSLDLLARSVDESTHPIIDYGDVPGLLWWENGELRY